MNISEHVSYREAVKSNTAKRLGIDNTPNSGEIYNMRVVANKIFEPVRNHFGVPIFISSFFRSRLLNKKIGGSKTSDHMKGKAIDIDDVLGGVTNSEIFHYIKDNLEFDQLIWEFGNEENPDWVHVSYNQENNRNQVLRAFNYVDWMGTTRTRYISYK
ncbi:MAG: D-Ala-D-Ala carboxypeptidase family metallohydrolase [Bacteroidota bacterium]